MYLPVPFQQLELIAKQPNCAFEDLYNKYAPAMYGLILKTVNQDSRLAEVLLKQIFIEHYHQKITASEIAAPPFISVLRTTIKVLRISGYSMSNPLWSTSTTPDSLN